MVHLFLVSISILSGQKSHLLTKFSGALIFSLKERRVGALPSQTTFKWEREKKKKGNQQVRFWDQLCLAKSLRAVKMQQPQWNHSAAKKPPFVLLEVDSKWDSLISKWVSKAAQTPDLPGRFLGRCLYTQSTRRVGNRTCPTGETLWYLNLFEISIQRKRKKNQIKQI